MTTATLTPPATPEPIRAALADGLRPGPPPWMGADDLAADVECALSLPCDECGLSCTSYRAVHRRRPRSYRAFATCRCGGCQEF